MAGRAENLTNAGKGRPKGSPNRSTAGIKRAFADAFEQRGGVTALLTWAEKHETEFYRLVSKLIPTEINGPSGGAIPVALTSRLDMSQLDENQLRVLASIPVLRAEEALDHG